MAEKTEKDELFTCMMDDGSEFKMLNEYWNKAFLFKYPIDTWERVKEAFRREVAEHWQEKTVPTKFGFDDSWEEEYQNQAELAEEVMCCHIRAALMGLILAQETGGKGKVIALSDSEEATIYSDKEPEKKSIDELFNK